MNKTQNDAIKMQIFLERYKNGEGSKIVSLFDSANRDIAKALKTTKGVYTKKRYQEIAQKVKESAKNLRGKIEGKTDAEGLISYELAQSKKLIADGLGKDVELTIPTVESVKAAALFKPATDTLTYQSYLDGIEQGLYNVWDSNLRTGYLTGMTTKEITKNVLGSTVGEGKLMDFGAIRSLRNSVYANTRTLLQSIAEEARMQVFAKNEDLLGDIAPDGKKYKFEYLATLDNRTCIVCGSMDGKKFATLAECPRLPQHRGCRCLVIPYFNVEGETRAAKGGPEDSKVTFEEWLKKQDEATQKDVLGKTRFEMFKSGDPISQFVDNGKVLTIEQLKEKDDLRYNFFNKGKAKTFEEAKER